ncbi:VOC family protein [Shewanella acanthi]|uniref:VOC family protein n=1 Tax=Shewanella acanthi TaxID=2864212 RepID=UPI001C655CFA|nr:VOC family protein [Shewanella acanthi]QYJ79992.1 VOC family protein [Shewanella acanthi]
MAKVIGFGGIYFKSSDPTALANWYQTHLQLPLEEWGGAVFFPKNLPQGSYQTLTPFPQDTDYFAPSEKPYMFNLVVDDLELILAQITAGGGIPIDSIEDTEFGRFAWFIDPDGNKIELWQPSST